MPEKVARLVLAAGKGHDYSSPSLKDQYPIFTAPTPTSATTAVYNSTLRVVAEGMEAVLLISKVVVPVGAVMLSPLMYMNCT